MKRTRDELFSCAEGFRPVFFADGERLALSYEWRCPDPLWRVIGRGIAALLPRLKLDNPSWSFALIWTMLTCGGQHPINQAAWE